MVSTTSGPATETRTYSGDLTAAQPLRPGVLVANRYTLGGVLGAGATAVVYEAGDGLLGTRVAIKILNVSLEANRLERFRREFIAGREGHPNLVRTVDTGVWEGKLYLAMELIRGATLSERIVEDGPFSVSSLTQLAEELLEGLAYLHSRGIVHRDVKAGNVLLTNDGTAKLADFGLARAPDDLTVTGTREGIGTPAYMAPEQIRGDKAGAPADLYSLGVVLYEAATGRRPFDADSYAAVIQQHLASRPDPGRLAGVPRRLRSLILRLLEKDPRRRFTDARACLEAWRRRHVLWRPRLRPAMTAAAAGAVVLGGAFLGPPLLLDATRVEQVGDHLRAVSRLGTTAWTHEVGTGTLVQQTPATRTLPAGFLVADYESPGDQTTSRLRLLDRRGRTVCGFNPREESKLLRDNGMPGTLVVFRLLPASDIDGDGWPNLLAILYGSPWYLSTIAEVFPDAAGANAEPLVFNPGIIERAVHTDADGDGRPEWYVAAMNNELLHTACVYRLEGSALSWPPPRYGTEPAFPSLAWFNAFSREGGATFEELEVLPGGAVRARMDSGATYQLDRWGNLPGDLADGRTPEEISAERAERYSRLSSAHLLLLDHDSDGARRELDRLGPADFGGDPIAAAYRLLLLARAALLDGAPEEADRLALESGRVAPISNTAIMFAVHIRLLTGKWDQVNELIGPDPSLTMGSPSDFQEMRGLLAWLQGRDDEAWDLFTHRAKLPFGITAQHRARILLAQGRAREAAELLADRAGIMSHERLDLLSAIAFAQMGDLDRVGAALAEELDRHPWLQPECDVVSAWLECAAGAGSAARLGQAVAAAERRAQWDLYAFLDLPLLRKLKAEGAEHAGGSKMAHEVR